MAPPKTPGKRPWFRFYVESIWDLKLRRLPAYSRWLWVVVLACARSSPIPGYLLITDGDPMALTDLADGAALSVSQTKKGIDLLRDLGLVDFDAGRQVWFVPKWGERQFEADFSRPFMSVEKRNEVFARDNFECVECGAGANLTIDHIKPVTKGGTDDIENLQTLCNRCNSRKGNRERQKSYRERQRNESAALGSNAKRNGVTPPETETETDSEVTPPTPPPGGLRANGQNPRAQAARRERDRILSVIDGCSTCGDNPAFFCETCTGLRRKLSEVSA